MAWSDPAKIPPVMVAVSAERAMAILVIGGMNVVISLDDVNRLGSAWSEVLVKLADCLLFSNDLE